MSQLEFRPKSLFVFIALTFLLHSSHLVVEGTKRKSEETIVNSIGMKYRLIPAGEFLMGSTGEIGRLADEHQHAARISRPFYLSVFEVTQKEYEQVMGRNPSFFSHQGKGKYSVAGWDTSRFPVEGVSWKESVAFCRQLSALPAEKKARRSYRLPTEAEWEYACRAGGQSIFHYGDTLSSTQANFDGNYPLPCP